MRQATTRSFTRADTLLRDRIRKASESRGFAQSRILTHWSEIAGADLSATTRPVSVSYAQRGLGATLTVLTTGANAPLIEMQKEQLRARINAVYGYNAIARIRVTQTAAEGFAEGRAQFVHRKGCISEPSSEPDARARAAADGVRDDGLRDALVRLAQNVRRRTPNNN